MDVDTYSNSVVLVVWLTNLTTYEAIKAFEHPKSFEIRNLVFEMPEK